MPAITPITTFPQSNMSQADFNAAYDSFLNALPLFISQLNNLAGILPLYLGATSSAPTVQNDGSALVPGNFYVLISTNTAYAWTGSNWTIAGVGDPELAALAGLTSAADKLPYFTGSGTAGVANLSAFFRTLTGSANLSALLTLLALDQVNNTSDANKSVSAAQQTALNLKANLASPTFTGTVNGITAAMVGLANVNNTSDATKPVSTATQTALNLLAPLSSPTLTGTPTAPTATLGTNTTQLANTAFVSNAVPNNNMAWNGGMLVQQGTAVAFSLNTSAYGVVDGFQLNCSNATAGTSAAYALNNKQWVGFVGLTASAGVLSMTHKIESKDCARSSGKALTCSVTVYQTTGSALSISFSLSKPNAIDNFSATTGIMVLAGVSVPTSTVTRISFTVAANVANDLSNGAYLSLFNTSVTCTASYIIFSDFKFEEGTVATPFMYDSYSNYLEKCQYYYRGAQDKIGVALTTNSASFVFPPMFKTPILGAPVLDYGSGAAFTALSKSCFYQSSVNSATSGFALTLDARP